MYLLKGIKNIYYLKREVKTNVANLCLIAENGLTKLASAKSKGALLVSAIHPIKNIIKTGNKGNKK